jgi:hypothetical protein
MWKPLLMVLACTMPLVASAGPVHAQGGHGGRSCHRPGRSGSHTLLFDVLFLALLLPQAVSAQPATHTIFVNAVEYKGSTTTEKCAPPQVNPTTLSKGYAYKGPGVAVRAFVVNGDKHDVSVLAPDGQVVVPTAAWTRGGEYQISFKAEKVGTYKLSCAIHAPSMTANMVVLPR